VSDIKIRFATADDAGLLLQLIGKLADYERAPNAVVATEEDLRRYGFGPERHFEALLAFIDGEAAGFALFHPRFSTWLGRPGVYLEDLFVTQAARGKGFGRRLMTRLVAVAVERGWKRIDFQVLDWNPARDFYRRLGLEFLHEHNCIAWRMFDCLVEDPGGSYRWPEKPWLPLAFSLKARAKRTRICSGGHGAAEGLLGGVPTYVGTKVRS
jgi:GNAT superfamily N-acetyltransferase